MAVASATGEVMIMDPSPSRLASDAASGSSSPPQTSFAGELSDHSYPPPSSSPNHQKDPEAQALMILRSEEYRQLFRLPSEEVLVEDFNCAFQENILIQKIIPFHEVTSVRRAKTAGIFPNAIEISAGGKKYFFGSFLSRDEAFKLINDGWLQHSNGAKAIAEQQESTSPTSSPGHGIVIEKVQSFKQSIDESNSTDRNTDTPISEDSKLAPNAEHDTMPTTLPNMQENVVGDVIPVPNTDLSSSSKTELWKEEDYDAPKLPDVYTKVSESKFPIKVEDFFNFFFSDDAVDFIESFHKKCGDKEFRCSSWYPHDKFGHARDVSFQHPIKIYFGAKYGSCQETQKFRVYRNSHLVVETSQEVSDVPYADYFRVEAIWDVERDADESKECCFLQVYVNVAFSKRTVWKGKIVQSTLEECRDAYAIWMNMAHELLMKKKLEKREEGDPVANLVQNGDIPSESEAKGGKTSERLHEPSSEHTRLAQMSVSTDVNQQFGDLQGNSIGAFSFASWFRESMKRFHSSLKNQGNLSLIIIVIFAVIFLMQMSILALLARPQHIHVHSPADYLNGMGGGVGAKSSESMAWLEKRIHHLKDEMYMVESRLERMRHEHSILKSQLEDLIQHSSKQR
ncbi:protein VASCULAR ASSOCIATED DEATH 1, chloroplastic isoform X2 [Ziziphus jujuba]|uniref:Protein VASCULAR ASSOCIATED DEATH 1, chloroplastic isoform X2 n=1 Tax=Ziziphus jujuba TaxID=326968 RepID=A0ABM4A9S5_ZIZJJ|nr:protein VASCULAR ASSOCIATED DEATH 1, chloroplastic isoform X2 [Ziziphus jujuba]